MPDICLSDLKYCSISGVKLRLRNRLQVDPSGFSTGSIHVDEDTIVYYGSQVEAKIDLVLAQIYKMPLTLSSPITRYVLQGISEKLISVEIINTYFNQFPQTEQGSENGYGNTLLKQANQELFAIAAGHHVTFFGIQTPSEGSYSPTLQPLVLPGEELAGYEDRPDTVTKNYTIVTDHSRNSTSILNETGIDFTYYGQKRYGQRLSNTSHP